MDKILVNNFIINIKASKIVNSFLYDYLYERGYFDELMEEFQLEEDEDAIHVEGYTYDDNQNIILVFVSHIDETCDSGVGFQIFKIKLENFSLWLEKNT